MKIGDMLVKLREKKDITRKQLASLAGIQYHALAKYEQNVAAPNIETLIQLANIFNVTIDELVGRDLKTYLRPDNKKSPPNWRTYWLTRKRPGAAKY